MFLIYKSRQSLSSTHNVANHRLDLQSHNVIFSIRDLSILSKFEEDEANSPAPRKIAGDRTIYLSRSLPLSVSKPIICDLGEARMIRPEKYYDDIMPNIYRAPEVILNMGWDEKVDSWNIGMMVSFTRHPTCMRGLSHCPFP